MDMDWDQIATLAQLVTGVATLAVAVLLVSQLRQQHRDSEREILYASRTMTNDNLEKIIDPDFGPIWHKGSQNFDSLSGHELEQFRIWNQMAFFNISVNHRAGHEGIDRGIDSRIFETTRSAFLSWPGMASYYERYGRDQTYDPALRGLMDEAFSEATSREVEASWRRGVKEKAS
jgi:hypothetical protein